MPGAAAYLDHNATSPLRPAAADAMTEAMAVTGNPSSVHSFGRSARALVEAARRQVADLAGASPAEVIFTSGATEANALAMAGMPAAARLVSAVEHPSVLENAPGARVIPVDRHGVVDLEALDGALREAGPGALVSVMAANNETGVLQPVAEAAEIAQAHGARLHVDAVQVAGKQDLAPVWAAADFMSLSAHKLGGPAGVGALLVRSGLTPAPLFGGGGQERRQRAGTENVMGIAGFGAAAAAAGASLPDSARIDRLRTRLESAVLTALPGTVIHGDGAARLPNTACLGAPDVAAETLVMALDLEGVAVSAGSACSSGKVQASHVLRAMGLDDRAAGAAIRISLGWNSTDADVDAFLAAWPRVAASRRAA